MKKRIVCAGGIAGVYALIYLVCWQLFFVGREFYLYTPDWTAKNILWIAAVVSVAPVFWGYCRFAIVTLAGYVLGVVFGELFGETMVVMQADMPPMPYHRGWWICVLFYLLACIVGVLVEKLLAARFRQNTGRC